MQTRSKAPSASKLKKQVEDYIAQCNCAGIFPDLPGMRLFLGLGREELSRLQENDACKAVLDYAADCRESWLVRKMCEDNKLSTACMNVLRQSENGGYGEKSGSGKGLEIRFSGNIDADDFM